MQQSLFKAKTPLFVAIGRRPRRAPVCRASALFLLAVVLPLSGCAVLPSGSSNELSYDDLMGRAETSALVGDRADAIEAYEKAAEVNPVAAKPWVELSQLYFKGDDYGHAIIAAREGLMRKPSSWRADSILTISGLRVAFESLARLRNKVGVSGTVKQEAQRLVQLLRTLLGEQALVTGGEGLEASEPSSNRSARGTAPDPEPQPEPVITESSVSDTLKQLQKPQSSEESGNGNPFSVLEELSSN